MTMAKKKKKRKSGKISPGQLMHAIVRATDEGKAVYEFYPGSVKMDFVQLYCDGMIKPGGTRKKGWIATSQGIRDYG